MDRLATATATAIRENEILHHKLSVVIVVKIQITIISKMANTNAVAECAICLEGGFNRSTRMRSDCIYCNKPYCRPCLKTYLESSSDGFKCANCREPWTDDNVMAMLPKTYAQKELRRLKTKMLVEREKQLMPDTMAAASQYKQDQTLCVQLVQQLNELKAQKAVAVEKYNFGRDNTNVTRDDINVMQARIVQLQHELNRARDRRFTILTGDLNQNEIAGDEDDVEAIAEANEDAEIAELLAATAEKEDSSNNGNGTSDKKVRYFKPCPVENCNGFLSTRWKCGICNVKVCKDCLEIKKKAEDGNDLEHTCRPEDLASAQEIKNNCKDCPNPQCRTKIFRVSGCSQMWCTKCRTTFDWNTGKVDKTGMIHNPHYTEWMRQHHQEQTGQGNHEGQMADFINPCDGQGLLDVSNRISLLPLSDSDYGYMLREYARLMVEMHHRTQQEFRLPNLEMRNRELRIKFTVGELPADEYARQLFLADRKLLSTQDYSNLHAMIKEQMLVVLGGLLTELQPHLHRTAFDLLTDNNLLSKPEAEAAIKPCLDNLHELRRFYSDQLITLNSRYARQVRSTYSHGNHLFDVADVEAARLAAAKAAELAVAKPAIISRPRRSATTAVVAAVNSPVTYSVVETPAPAPAAVQPPARQFPTRRPAAVQPPAPFAVQPPARRPAQRQPVTAPATTTVPIVRRPPIRRLVTAQPATISSTM